MIGNILVATNSFALVNTIANWSQVMTTMHRFHSCINVLDCTGMQLGMAEGVELLSHLTPEERHSVLSTAAARDSEDLEQFAKYVRWLLGREQNDVVTIQVHIDSGWGSPWGIPMVHVQCAVQCAIT